MDRARYTTSEAHRGGNYTDQLYKLHMVGHAVPLNLRNIGIASENGRYHMTIRGGSRRSSDISLERCCGGDARRRDNTSTGTNIRLLMAINQASGANVCKGPNRLSWGNIPHFQNVTTQCGTVAEVEVSNRAHGQNVVS